MGCSHWWRAEPAGLEEHGAEAWLAESHTAARTAPVFHARASPSAGSQGQTVLKDNHSSEAGGSGFNKGLTRWGSCVISLSLCRQNL